MTRTNGALDLPDRCPECDTDWPDPMPVHDDEHSRGRRCGSCGAWVQLA